MALSTRSRWCGAGLAGADLVRILRKWCGFGAVRCGFTAVRCGNGASRPAVRMSAARSRTRDGAIVTLAIRAGYKVAFHRFFIDVFSFFTLIFFLHYRFSFSFFFRFGFVIFFTLVLRFIASVFQFFASGFGLPFSPSIFRLIAFHFARRVSAWPPKRHGSIAFSFIFFLFFFRV